MDFGVKSVTLFVSVITSCSKLSLDTLDQNVKKKMTRIQSNRDSLIAYKYDQFVEKLIIVCHTSENVGQYHF